jgi:hypothetical protein
MRAAFMTLTLAAAFAATAQEAEQKKTWIPPLQLGDSHEYLLFYGVISMGVLVYDDGQSTLGYVPVGNFNYPTRFGLKGYKDFENEWYAGLWLEEQFDPFSTAAQNQTNRGEPDWDRHQPRQIQIYGGNKRYGKLWLGQGDRSSEDSAEVDLSGTSLAGFAAQKEASGQFIVFDDGSLSKVKNSQAFNDHNGLGRHVRARYDSPTLYGFYLSTSYGRLVLPPEVSQIDTGTHFAWDIALWYSDKLGSFKAAGGVAYSYVQSMLQLIDGSFSILHEPTGLNLTVSGAYTYQQPKNIWDIYGKLGIQTRSFSAGNTDFSIDSYYGQDQVVAGSRSVTVGAQVQQHLDYLRLEPFIDVRFLSYGEPTTSYRDAKLLLTGARFSF